MKDALKRATLYLERCQNPDGSWGTGDPFVCARAADALKACNGSEVAGELAAGFLEGCQSTDGSFQPRSDLYTVAASTAFSLIVLNHFDYSKVSMPVSKGLMWLLENQNPDGSWNGRNTNKNAYTTSLCLRALHQYYLSGLAKYRKGVDHVLDKVTEPAFFNEPVSHVYAPVLNLSRIEQLQDEIKEEFVTFSERNMSLSIDSGQVADVACLCGTLGAIGENYLRNNGINWLISNQRSDGGYGKNVRSDSDPNWTSLVILALSNKL